MKNSLCAAGLLLAACAMPPRTRLDEVVVKPPAVWQAGEGTAGEVDREWWTGLGDPALTRAIHRMLAHNHDLRAAQARLAAAAIQARLAGVESMPTLDLDVSAMRQRSVFVGLPTGFATSSPLSNTFNSFGVSLAGSWEVDLWGRIRAGVNAEFAELRATTEDLRGARQSLAAQTAKVWFAAIEARQQIELARTTTASYLETEGQVESRFRRGVRSALDLRLARSRRMTAEAQQHLWAERYERTIRQLEVLEGRYPDGESRISDRLPPVQDPVPAGLPADTVRRRPDLIAAEQRLVAAGFRVGQAHASLYPRFALTGSVGTSSDRVGDLLDLDFLIFNAAANLVAPIFDGGRRRGELDLAAARESEAIAGFAQAALLAYSEVETLLAAERHLRRQVDSLVVAEVEAKAARTLAEDRYLRGVGEFIAVLDAQRSALTIERQLLTARRQLLDLRVDLHLALGGGFEVRKKAVPGAER